MCVSRLVVSDSFMTPWTVAHKPPLSLEFSRQEYWNRLPFPSPGDLSSVQFSRSVVSDSLRPHECQASLSITNSRSSARLRFTKSVMPSNHLIFCHPLLLLPSIFPCIRVFSNESDLRIRWPKYWSFNFSISPSSEYSGLFSFRID